MGNQTGGNHDDCRICSCDCSGCFDCVGRVGAANAGKLSGANLPYYGRDDSNFFALLPPNSVTKLTLPLGL
jgi:hypothetical protein